LLRGYPDKPSAETQQALRNYLEALVYLIPCPSCAAHWKDIVGTVDTSSRVAALKWSIDTHNAVNHRLRKPVLTYSQALQALDSKCPHDGGYTAPPGWRCKSWRVESAIMTAIIVVLFVAIVVLVVLCATATRRTKGVAGAQP
jgi:hypothetical protein